MLEGKGWMGSNSFQIISEIICVVCPEGWMALAFCKSCWHEWGVSWEKSHPDMEKLDNLWCPENRQSMSNKHTKPKVSPSKQSCLPPFSSGTILSVWKVMSTYCLWGQKTLGSRKSEKKGEATLKLRSIQKSGLRRDVCPNITKKLVQRGRQ